MMEKYEYLIFIKKMTLSFYPSTVHENDGSQPTQPLLCMVFGVHHLPAVDHRNCDHCAKVWQNSAKQRRLPDLPVPLWLWFERHSLQLHGQLLLRQDLHRWFKWQPPLHPLLLPLHCGLGPGVWTQRPPKERPGENAACTKSTKPYDFSEIRKHQEQHVCQ